MEQQESKPVNQGPLVISLMLLLLGAIIALFIVRIANLQKDTKERAIGPSDRSTVNHRFSSGRHEMVPEKPSMAVYTANPDDKLIGSSDNTTDGIVHTERIYEENTDIIGGK